MVKFLLWVQEARVRFPVPPRSSFPFFFFFFLYSFFFSILCLHFSLQRNHSLGQVVHSFINSPINQVKILSFWSLTEKIILRHIYPKNPFCFFFFFLFCRVELVDCPSFLVEVSSPRVLCLGEGTLSPLGKMWFLFALFFTLVICPHLYLVIEVASSPSFFLPCHIFFFFFFF